MNHDWRFGQINHRLREARRARGLTPKQLAMRLGYSSPNRYLLIENGQSRASLPIALQLAKIVGEEADALFPGIVDVHCF
ncbi:helix-turn-helix transcriptional regulator [Paenibacillus ginsengarvi]|uniref:XRE family transcriptional regulator n=1 Tax=Paenibacillus ginsengarvi TaxID=400777 RepID=A0A3B0BVS1_9BACL|nr:helix-turn-helix transcriptional regulator [Paenibacillus ginsengarvi]RKN77090.1 XRE family transcriptional regulator [Paenibacillus ginsengarvi]